MLRWSSGRRLGSLRYGLPYGRALRSAQPRTHGSIPVTGDRRLRVRAAKSFLDYGKRIDSPRVGAIVVLARGVNNGHVGIVRGTDGAGNIIVISGNHGNKVWESPYPKSRVLGYVIPPESN